jgi:hypothetical protein
MQKWQQAIILFFLVLIPFIVYVGRPGLVDTDSYYYLLISCHNTEQISIPVSNDLVGSTIFSFFPCSEIVAKIFLFFLCIVSAFLLWKTAELFDKENAWLAPVFAIVFSNLFIWQFLKFENDAIAIPFLFAATYFFLKAKKENNLVLKIATLCLICFAGMFWKGSFIYLVAFGFSWLPMLFLALLILFIVGPANLVVFYPNSQVGENRSLSGIIKMFLLLLGIGEAKETIFSKELVVLFLFGLFAQKYAFFVVPFLAIGTMLYWKKIDFSLKTIFCFGGAMLYVFLLLQILFAPLQSNDWEAIHYAVDLANGAVFQNDWDVGYQIIFAGGKPAYYGGSTNIVPSGIVLTNGNQDCNVLKRFNQYVIYQC